jgi:6-phosphogluconolactonase
MAYPGVEVFDDASGVAREGAERFVKLCQEAVGSRGAFHVALSGGKTPAVLFRRLAEEEMRKKVDWNKVHLYWSDERTVPPADPDSNYGMAERELIARINIPAHNVHRMQAERPDLEKAAEEYEATLRKHLPAGPGGFPCFDLIYLGMGPDGHTASLFPGSPGLAEQKRAVIAHHVIPPNFPPSMRMTFTFPLLNAARMVLFLITGADKTEKLREVLKGTHQPPYPSQQVRPVNGQRLFLIDKAAAADLG